MGGKKISDLKIVTGVAISQLSQLSAAALRSAGEYQFERFARDTDDRAAPIVA